MQVSVQDKPYQREYLFHKSCEYIKRQINEQSKISISLFSQQIPEESIEIHNHLLTHLNEVLQVSIIPERKVTSIIILGGLGQLPQFYLGLDVFKRICEVYHQLRFVVLENCNIGDEGIKIIKQCKLAYLQNLNLIMNRFSKKGMKILAGCTLNDLGNLDLDYYNIGNTGISYLTKANWPALHYFSVIECKATFDAYRVIQKANWPQLQKFSIQGNKEDLFCAASQKRFARQYTPLPLQPQQDSQPLSRWNAEFLKKSKRAIIVFSKK